MHCTEHLEAIQLIDPRAFLFNNHKTFWDKRSQLFDILQTEATSDNLI